jgi:hypothetical protein
VFVDGQGGGGSVRDNKKFPPCIQAPNLFFSQFVCTFSPMLVSQGACSPKSNYIPLQEAFSVFFYALLSRNCV